MLDLEAGAARGRRGGEIAAARRDDGVGTHLDAQRQESLHADYRSRLVGDEEARHAVRECGICLLPPGPEPLPHGAGARAEGFIEQRGDPGVVRLDGSAHRDALRHSESVERSDSRLTFPESVRGIASTK